MLWDIIGWIIDLDDFMRIIRSKVMKLIAIIILSVASFVLFMEFFL